MSTPARATTVPTRNETPNPLMNAARAAPANKAPVAPPTAWATVKAPPSEPKMGCVTVFGRCLPVSDAVM